MIPRQSIRHPLAALGLSTVALLAACGDASDSKRLESAKRYLQQRDGGAAVIELKNVLQSNPGHAGARFLLGKTFLDGGDPVAAEAELRRALEAGHPNSEIIPALAGALVTQRRFEPMLKEFGAVDLADATASAALSMLRARAHLALQAHAEAQKQLDAALAKVPKYRPALAQQARLFAERGEAARAAAIAEGLVAERADDAEAWGGDAGAAAAALRKSLALRADGEAARLLVETLHEGQRTTDADRFAREWLLAHPKDTAFLLSVAYLAERRSELDEAERRLQQVLAINPQDAAALNNLAQLRVKLKQPDALELAERANRITPNQPAFMDTLAQALAAAQKPDQALKLQTTVVEMSPDLPELRLTLAKIQLQAGKTDAAAENVALLAKLGPGFSGHDEVKQLAGRLRK